MGPGRSPGYTLNGSLKGQLLLRDKKKGKSKEKGGILGMRGGDGYV
jgi:hypothetical protein